MPHCRKIGYVIPIKFISVCVGMCVRMLLFMSILNTKKYNFKILNETKNNYQYNCRQFPK